MTGFFYQVVSCMLVLVTPEFDLDILICMNLFKGSKGFAYPDIEPPFPPREILLSHLWLVVLVAQCSGAQEGLLHNGNRSRSR